MSRILPLLCATCLLGCAAVDTDLDGLSDRDELRMGTDPNNPDTDGDTLSDGEEVLLGTSPLLSDTDGDGYQDADELLEGTNPLDPASVIYLGGWPYSRDKDLLGTPSYDGGLAVGDYAPRIRGVDQFGQIVDLYDYAYQGKNIFVDVCGIWKIDCKAWASIRSGEPAPGGWEQIEPMHQKINRGDFYSVTILSGGSEYQELAVAEETTIWADIYPHPAVPVILDDDRQFYDWAVQDHEIQYMPVFMLLNEEMRILKIDRDTDPGGWWTLTSVATER